MTTYTQVLNNPIDAMRLSIIADRSTFVTVTATNGAVLTRAILTGGASSGTYDVAHLATGEFPVHESYYPLTVSIETDGEDPRVWADSVTWIE